jgi:dATP pyrophosphohydrolase
VREVAEETGLDAASFRLADWGVRNEYEIYQEWRWRYALGVTNNTENVFGLTLPQPIDVRIAPRAHLAYAWLPWQQAADKCFCWSNAQPIRLLPEKLS